MVRVIFTLDYEIHGNGEGCPHALMVEPTARLLRLFDQFGAKLTILADVAEILKFKEYAEKNGCDDYHYGAIIAQLHQAVRTGHDVQLHLHSSYFNATHDGKRWLQDWSEYNFAGLDPARMDHMVTTGKNFLESVLRPVAPAYQCNVFRAANWSVSPSPSVVRTLVKNRFLIDTSIFKYGWREGLVNFDYRQAASDLLPWRADPDAIWRSNQNGPLWEVPIYTEERLIFAFLTVPRIARAISSRLHRVPRGLKTTSVQPAKAALKTVSLGSRFTKLASRHAWKADFNQCTGRQLVAAFQRAARRHAQTPGQIPFVLIGHSKLFSPWNERSLRPFLACIARDPSSSRFGTFASLGLPELKVQQTGASNVGIAPLNTNASSHSSTPETFDSVRVACPPSVSAVYGGGL